MHCQTREMFPSGILSTIWRRGEEEEVRTARNFLGAACLTHHQSPSGVNKYSGTNYRQVLLQRLKHPRGSVQSRKNKQQHRATNTHNMRKPLLATFIRSLLAPVQHYKHG